MDAFEQSLYVSGLFDLYQDLLTDKQVAYMKEYYYDDYSLQEIAENHSVSRNAVYDQIKKTIQKLEQFEQALKLHQKQKERKDLFQKLDKIDTSKDVKLLIQALKKVE